MYCIGVYPLKQTPLVKKVLCKIIIGSWFCISIPTDIYYVPRPIPRPHTNIISYFLDSVVFHVSEEEREGDIQLAIYVFVGSLNKNGSEYGSGRWEFFIDGAPPRIIH